MSLDVYVGTLSRYYADDWETFWEQAGRKAGVEALRMRDGERVRKGDTNEIRQSVVSWREEIQNSLPDATTLDWDESEEKPYFTYKPDWDGYAALVLHSAYAMHPHLPRPERVPDDWQQDPAYRSVEEGGLENNHCSFIMVPELWLPGDFTFLFQRRELRGQEVVIGSVNMLLANLHGLNGQTFRAEPETAARWLSRDVRDAENHFEANARYGFAIFLYLAEQAVANRLPLKLDY